MMFIRHKGISARCPLVAPLTRAFLVLFFLSLYLLCFQFSDVISNSVDCHTSTTSPLILGCQRIVRSRGLLLMLMSVTRTIRSISKSFVKLGHNHGRINRGDTSPGHPYTLLPGKFRTTQPHLKKRVVKLHPLKMGLLR